MARLPDAQSAFGSLASLDSRRPIARYDDTAIAKGNFAMGEAIDKGTAKLGSGFDTVSSDARSVWIADDNLDIAKRESTGVSRTIDLDSEFKHDTDYSTAEQRYKARLDKIKAEITEGASPRARGILETRFTDNYARGLARIKDGTFTKEAHANTGYRLEWGEQQLRKLPDIDDEVLRRRVVDTYGELVDGAVSKGQITPDHAVNEKRQFADRYVIGAGLTMIEKDPVQAVQTLEKRKGTIFENLRPDQHFTLLTRAKAALRRGQTEDLAEFNQREKDSVAEAMATGDVVKPIPEHEFTARHGPNSDEYRDYSANIQLGRDVHTVAQLSPEQATAMYRSYDPVPGEGFALQVKRQDALRKAIASTYKELDADPAGYALKYLPAVRDSYSRFAAVAGNPMATPADKRAAANAYAERTLIEQRRIGVPEEAIKVVPHAYVDGIAARIASPKASGGAGNVASMIEQERATWADHWPMVYKDLARKAGPVAMVVGSGVKPLAAQVLTELATTKFEDIVNDQNGEKSRTIRDEVRTAFSPFIKTMGGQEGSQWVFDAFQAQGDKLAAFYVRNGQTATDAAKSAYDDLLGHKYDIVGGSGWFDGVDHYRIPKGPHPLTPKVPADQIKRGADVAKASLEKFDIESKVSVPGTGPDYPMRETLRRYSRDGSWVTASGDVGLMLVYGNQAVTRRDGRELVVTWDELAELGKAPTTINPFKPVRMKP